MEENKNIDDLFRDAIESYKMEPPERVWNSVDDALSVKRDAMRRKRALRRWGASLAALFLLSGGLYLYYSGTGVPAAKENISSSSQAASGTQEKAAPHTSGKIENNISSDHNSSSSLNKDASGNLSAGTSVAESPASESNHSVKEIKKDQTQRTTKTPVASPSNSTASSNQNRAVRISAAVSSRKQPSSATVNGTESKHSPENSPGATGSIAAVQQSENNNAANNEPAVQESAGAATGNNIEENHVTTGAAVTANPEETQPVDVEESAVSTVKDSVADYNTDKASGSWMQRAAKKMSMDVYYSPDIASRSLKDNSSYTGTGASEGTVTYDNNEKSNYSWSAGIRFRAELSNGWSVGTGVYYSTFSQSSTSDNVYVVSDSAFHHDHDHGHGGGGHSGPPPAGGNSHYVIHTSCGTIDLHHQPHGSGGPPGDGDTLNITTKTTEDISYISIPLTARFQISGRRLSWYAEGGASINFEYTNSVTALVNNSYTETNDIVGLKSVNYSALLGVGMLYNIHRNWSFFLEPGMRYSLTSINENSPVLSYPYYFGLKTGFSIHF